MPLALLTLGVAASLVVGCTSRDQTKQVPSSADTALIPDPAVGPRDVRALYARPVSEWPAFIVDNGVDAVELGPVPDVVFPEDNPYSETKADLGEQLFFDPRLSASNQMACASCHDPDLGWADGKTVSFGTDRLQLARNAPTALGAGHVAPLFWDGRAESLEALSAEVINNADELHGIGDDVAAKLDAIPEYRDAFVEVFGDGDNASPVTLDRIAKAIATFVRTINPGRSRFDRFVAGRYNVLTDQELRGLHVFRTRANCMNCHHGPLFTDNQLHTTGLHLYGRRGEDLGAFRVTGKDEDRGAFRTPTLRHIERTGPYMHHGLFESLEVTVRSYSGGNKVGRPRGKQLEDPGFPGMSPLIHELNLTDDEISDLVAFLGTLTEPHRRIEPPSLPAGLYKRE